MKIKKIEVTGFKSFMERTVLTFPEKITAIVGPNGCGKSNIVDAIRWAIGEQSSKHLRGQGMEDMIFNGSEKFSALGMAEVKITFTNDGANAPIDYSEYNEITVSRRLYKSGESEYRINNTRCRLMDIKELFMDTGISAKAYAIIEQGKVSSIVNSKPKDKRIIIEEAAGITKYKNRKDAALKKIAATEQNLLRTKDIVHEIKNQLNSVEKQAKKAEEFKRLRQDFKDIEIKLIKLDNLNSNENLKKIELNLNKQDELAFDVDKKLKLKENELETLRIANLEVEKELAETQELYFKRLNEVKKKETEIEFKERRDEELREQKANNITEIESLKVTIDELKEVIKSSRQRVKEAESDFLKEQKHVLEVQKEHEEFNAAFREKRRIIDKEKSNLINTLTGIARTRNDISNFENHIDTLSNSIEKLKREEDSLNSNVLKVKKDLKDLTAANQTIQKEKKVLNQKSMQNELKLDDLNEKHKVQEEAQGAIENELKDVTARFNSLNELKESYEGFNEGIKTIMSSKKKLGIEKDVLGVITDFIDVPPEYETAVSSFFGERLEYIVVKNKKAISDAVALLKAEKKGKAGFVLISDAKGKKAVSGDKDHILQKIKVDDRLKDALYSIFKDAHLVDDFESAMKHFRSDNDKFYITKDGDVVGRTVYGGSSNVKSEAILKREREIKELYKKQSVLKKKHTVEATKLENLNSDISAAEAELDELRDSLHEVEIRSMELQNKINRSDEEAERLKSRDEIIKFELNEMKLQTDDMHNKLLLGKVRLEELSAQKEKKDELIEEYSNDCDELSISLNQKGEELTEARVNVARLKAEKENISRSIEHLNGTMETHTSRLLKLKDSIEIMEMESAEIKLRIKEIEAELKETIKASEKDKNDVEKLKITFQNNMELLRQGELKNSEIKHRLSDIINKKNELSLKKEEALLALRNIEEKLREKYQQPLDYLDTIEIAEDFDKSSSIKRLAALRKKIYDMGEVNLLAIEEYEELNTRYTYLVEQQEDLLKSISTLNKAIKRINRTSKKRFSEVFDLVNEKFKIVFPRLFNGGHAELKLLDEDNILESGVEIVAQPPGKKLGNLSLLSGGEKALTAVSLIFAIFMIKPSPFCLLDEVDAPLDDANIGRFNELVREMSETSQFLIITHSKHTMGVADTLYGVTMESPGISKIVSVQMH